MTEEWVLSEFRKMIDDLPSSIQDELLKRMKPLYKEYSKGSISYDEFLFELLYGS